ncbi:MAG: WYL domain-containing protein, partial [Sphingobacteriales bacterium]
MPRNKNFELRITLLDELLGSPRKRTFDELLEALNEHLEDGGQSKVSRRTLFNDLNEMETKKGAPIVRPTKSQPYIYYGEKFSIKNVPIDEEDISQLKQAISILKKATDLAIIHDLEGIISKLENKIHTNVPDSTTMIAFEEHTRSSGQNYFDDLFNAIKGKCALKITYQPFGQEPKEWLVSPYMLKEYNNRWFLICKRLGNTYPTNIALDRIKKIGNCTDLFEMNTLFDPDTYFNNLIGVSFPEDKSLETILIKINPKSADYVLTKPIHRSQEVVKKYADGGLKVSVQLYVNFELRSHLLSYGPRIEIIEPLKLREDMKLLYGEGADIYK